LIILKVSL